ncbi:hypothetical protein [Escherichia coli]
MRKLIVPTHYLNNNVMDKDAPASHPVKTGMVSPHPARFLNAQ